MSMRMEYFAEKKNLDIRFPEAYNHHITKYSQTVEVEVKAAMLIQRVREAEIRAELKPSYGPRRAQSNGEPQSILRR